MKSSEAFLDTTMIVVLVAACLAVRIPIAAERKIMPAGDVFNLQHITERIIHLDYPDKENRLPGYPLLLLLTRPFPVDPIGAGVSISIAASAFTLAFLYLTGQVLGIHRVALLTFLGLSIFDPILIVNAVRPLADATFILYLSLVILLITRACSERPVTRRSLLAVGAATAAMMFTRYEGYMIAAFTLPTLWLRRGLRAAATAAAIPFFTVLLWIPAYYSIHGSFTGGYIAELHKPSNNFAVTSEVPAKFTALMQGAGWGRAWAVPAAELHDEHPEKAAIRTVTNPAWWISVLAVLGAAWLLGTQRTKALPLFLALAGYVAVLVWWTVYGRFTAPLIPFFYLTAAAGGCFIITALTRLLQKK